MIKKLDPNPFDQLGKFWEKTQENYTNWHKAAEEFWKAYTAWWEHVFRNDLDKKQ